MPVVKKIEDTPGYENVIRDSQRGTAIKTRAPERKPELPTRPVNGIETDPTLVSNLLKESLAKPAPITVATERKSPEVKREPPAEPPPAPVLPAPAVEPPPPVEEVPEHRHKKEKKKKDKHKHKDRDKSKEERKKHKKDKEKRKESPPPQPVEPPQQDGALRITIPKEKLATSPGLKIKIPKDRLAAPPLPPQPQPSSLKIKISRDVLDASNRKRSAAQEPPAPPHKLARHNGAPHHPKVVEQSLGNGDK